MSKGKRKVSSKSLPPFRSEEARIDTEESLSMSHRASTNEGETKVKKPRVDESLSLLFTGLEAPSEQATGDGAPDGSPNEVASLPNNDSLYYYKASPLYNALMLPNFEYPAAQMALMPRFEPSTKVWAFHSKTNEDNNDSHPHSSDDTLFLSSLFKDDSDEHSALEEDLESIELFLELFLPQEIGARVQDVYKVDLTQQDVDVHSDSEFKRHKREYVERTNKRSEVGLRRAMEVAFPNKEFWQCLEGYRHDTEKCTKRKAGQYCKRCNEKEREVNSFEEITGLQYDVYKGRVFRKLSPEDWKRLLSNTKDEITRRRRRRRNQNQPN